VTVRNSGQAIVRDLVDYVFICVSCGRSGPPILADAKDRTTPDWKGSNLRAE
jgi:hypothetical protein